MQMVKMQSDKIKELQETVCCLLQKSDKEAERIKDLYKARNEFLQLRSEVKELGNNWKPQNAWSQVNSSVHGQSACDLKGKAPCYDTASSNRLQGMYNDFIKILLID